MFVVILFSLIGAIVAFTTTLYPSAYYGVIGMFIIVATTLILLLLFANKVSENSWVVFHYAVTNFHWTGYFFSFRKQIADNTQLNRNAQFCLLQRI